MIEFDCITLCWIKTHPSLLTTFISNRVAEIQECTVHVICRHVPTKHNPADIVSRGCYVDELKNSICFGGPAFLLKESTEWPVSKTIKLNPEQEYLKKKNLLFYFNEE